MGFSTQVLVYPSVTLVALSHWLYSTACSLSREKPKRKEVKTMSYNKPEITVSGLALGQIQGTSKPPEMDLDSHQQFATVSAYEADE